MTVGLNPRRAKSRWTFLAVLVTVSLLVGSVAVVLAGPVSNTAGFEGDDANLAVNDVTKMDWNGFATTTWLGTAPYRISEKVESGWKFKGLEDAQNDGTDTVFGGGVKQDNECAAVSNGPKPPNKSDLKRIYLATKQVNGDHYLALAWVRIAQNSTSASAHTAFEFNQSNVKCANSDLVVRTVGDMLIVYDFEGGSAPPLIKLARWQITGTCEQTNKPATAAGCWVVTHPNLVASGFAEAAVNVGGTAVDAIAPNPPETLGVVEFGEAIINLSVAGVFPSGAATECLTFGRVFGVSRSSGNSGVAQMKDLVGPGNIDVTNCGSIIVEKVDEDDSRLPGAGFTVTPGKTTNGTTATSSPMVETPVGSGLFCLDNLLIGVQYTVEETDVPEGYEGAEDQSFTVTAASTCAARIAAGAAPDLTFVNIPNVADISALKEVSTDGTTWDSTATASPGDTLYYRLTFENTGNASGTVSPTDDLSDVLEHATFNADCEADGTTDACSLDGDDILSFAGSPFSIAAGDTLVITYSVELDSTFPSGNTDLTNLIVAEDTNCPEGSTDPDCTTTTTVTAAADISALKEVSTDGTTWDSTATASPGDTLYYRLTFENTGDASGTVSPTDDLSDVLEYATFNDDCEANSAADDCSLDSDNILSFEGSPFTIAAGDTLVITYSVDVNTSGFDDSVDLTNLIVAEDTNCPEGSTDPDCTTTTTVDPEPDVTITKVATSNFPPTFDVTVDAIGTGTSTNVVVTDTLPADWTWALSGDYGTCDDDDDTTTPFDPSSVAGGTSITCSFGDMAEGSSQTFTITAIAGPGLENTANVSSDNQSTDDNKTDTASIEDILAPFGPPQPE